MTDSADISTTAVAVTFKCGDLSLKCRTDLPSLKVVSAFSVQDHTDTEDDYQLCSPNANNVDVVCNLTYTTLWLYTPCSINFYPIDFAVALSMF